MQRPIVTRVCAAFVFGCVCWLVAGAAQATYVEAITGANPLGYWRLDEASGATAANQVSGGAVGVYNSFSSGDYGQSGALAALGDSNAAAGFDGTDNYLTIDESVVSGIGAGAYTIEMWFKANNVTSRADFFNYKGGTSDIGVGVENGKIQCLVGNAWLAGSTVSTGSWYHVAMTRDASSNVKIYLNGVEDMSGSGTESFGALGNSLWFGANNSSGAPAVALNGAMDEIAIYGYALTESQAMAHYHGVPEPTSAMLAFVGLLGLLAYAWRKRK